MKINSIAFICYPVKNLKIAREFYEKVLGLKATNTWIKDDTNGFIEYDIGDTTLAIGAGATNFTPGKDGPTVALEVEDFDAALKKLNANKVKFILEKAETPVCNMAVFEDPDGSKLMIHRRKSK